MKLSTRIPSSSQLRAHEAAWINMCHPTWGTVLMELAGKKAAEVVISLWDEAPGTVAIFCGTGNNGGDGLVIARYLYLCGVPVSVIMLKAAGKKSVDRIESSVNKS